MGLALIHSVETRNNSAKLFTFTRTRHSYISFPLSPVADNHTTVIKYRSQNQGRPRTKRFSKPCSHNIACHDRHTTHEQRFSTHPSMGKGPKVTLVTYIPSSILLYDQIVNSGISFVFIFSFTVFNIVFLQLSLVFSMGVLSLYIMDLNPRDVRNIY